MGYTNDSSGKLIVQSDYSAELADYESKVWGWNETILPDTLYAPLPVMQLRTGETLIDGKLGYETFGKLSENADNAILVFTGMSGNAHIASRDKNADPGWWESIVGCGEPVDTNHWFVICVNYLGGCYGSIGPASIDPQTGRVFGPTFPIVSIEDMADASMFLLDYIGIKNVACLIGVSMGGMASLSFLQRHPGIAKTHLNVSGAPAALAYAISLRSIQRQIVQADPDWFGGHYGPEHHPLAGMTLARKLGVLSYRSSDEFEDRFGRSRVLCEYELGTRSIELDFEVENYIEHLAKCFAEDFDPNSFLALSSAMDQFSLSESANDTVENALADTGLEQALVLGSSSDVLFPPKQQKLIANAFELAGVKTHHENLHSMKGHDAFLADIDSFGPPISEFFQSLNNSSV